MMSIIANGGFDVNPRLVAGLVMPGGRWVKEYPPCRGERIIDPATVNQMKYLLNSVTDYGTGKGASPGQLNVGGKTGTAETGRVIGGQEELLLWFAGFTPLIDTRAVIVVFIEEAREEVTPVQVFREIVEEITPLLE